MNGLAKGGKKSVRDSSGATGTTQIDISEGGSNCSL